MINNRTLAVAAVVLLGIPALGAAAPIAIDDPTPEQLVEGHTVFTVIEIVNNTTTIQSRFAAAVAVLVREYEATAQNLRFPGVLWFNDQYLVNPVSPSANENVVYRYPCGGAVLAVNAGDPDPRSTILTVNDGTEGEDEITGEDHLITATGNQDGVDHAGSDASWVNVTSPSSGSPTVRVEDSNNLGASGTSPATPDQQGWWGPGGFQGTGIGDPGSAGSASTRGAYRESYYITDPNDHVWIIDKYDAYTRRTVTVAPAAPNLASQPYYQYTVWVVNILGGPIFLPDDGISNCGPYNDLLTQAARTYGAGAASSVTGQADNQVEQPWNDNAVNHSTVGGREVYTPLNTYYETDHAYGRYKQPSDNNYCYNGVSAAAGCGTQPLRIYNALLYFKMEDLKIQGDPRDHSNPTTSTDTNGCQSDTEWACPVGTGGEDDDREGNSHPFHPTATTAHTEANAQCPDAYDAYAHNAVGGANAANHGGSTSIDTPRRNGVYQSTGNNQYFYGGPCDHYHATFNIDVYFSPAGRPFPPLDRSFTLVDTQGSSAPFADYDCMYATCPTGAPTHR